MPKKIAEGRSSFKDEAERDAFAEKLRTIAARHYSIGKSGTWHLKPASQQSEFKSLAQILAECNKAHRHVAQRCRDNPDLRKQIIDYARTITGRDHFYYVDTGTNSLVVATGPDTTGADHIVHLGKIYGGLSDRYPTLNRPDTHLMLQPYADKSSLRAEIDLDGYMVEAVPKVLIIRSLILSGELKRYDPETGLNEMSVIYRSLYRSCMPNYFPEDLGAANIALLPNGQPVVSDPNCLVQGSGKDNEAARKMRDLCLLNITPEAVATEPALASKMATFHL